MKAHEIKTDIIRATGRDPSLVHHGDDCFEVMVLGDEPENVVPVVQALQGAGIPHRKKPSGKAFKGATYLVPIKNVGTVFHADWQYA